VSDDRIDQHIEVEGQAYPSAAGATVHTGEQSYYLGGGVSWDTGMIGKRVRVSGLLRLRRAQVETRPPDEEQEHGLTDDTFVIEEPKWTLLD
jgi:hypothetical protein